MLSSRINVVNVGVCTFYLKNDIVLWLVLHSTLFRLDGENAPGNWWGGIDVVYKIGGSFKSEDAHDLLPEY